MPAIKHAYALLGTGRQAEYQQACLRLFEMFGTGPVASSQNKIAWLCALMPQSLVDADNVLRMAKSSRADSPGAKSPDGVSKLIYGVCLYRIGRIDESVKVLTDSTEVVDEGNDILDQHKLACAKYFLALARYELGHDFQVQRLLSEANELNEGLSDRLRNSWSLKIELDALRQQAELLIPPN